MAACAGLHPLLGTGIWSGHAMRSHCGSQKCCPAMDCSMSHLDKGRAHDGTPATPKPQPPAPQGPYKSPYLLTSVHGRAYNAE